MLHIYMAIKDSLALSAAYLPISYVEMLLGDIEGCLTFWALSLHGAIMSLSVLWNKSHSGCRTVVGQGSIREEDNIQDDLNTVEL